MRRLTIVLSMLAVLALVAGCGKSSSSSSSNSGNGGAAAVSTTGSGQTSTNPTVHFAKTKFVLHAGLAFGAFHRYIYKPFKAGKLGGGLLTNKLAKIKAALAAAFAYHELKLALKAAQGSAILRKVLTPVTALQAKLHSLTSGLKHGNTSSVESASTDVNGISSIAGAAGNPISDLPTPSLGG